MTKAPINQVSNSSENSLADQRIYTKNNFDGDGFRSDSEKHAISDTLELVESHQLMREA